MSLPNDHLFLLSEAKTQENIFKEYKAILIHLLDYGELIWQFSDVWSLTVSDVNLKKINIFP